MGMPVITVIAHLWCFMLFSPIINPGFVQLLLKHLVHTTLKMWLPSVSNSVAEKSWLVNILFVAENLSAVVGKKVRAGQEFSLWKSAQGPGGRVNMTNGCNTLANREMGIVQNFGNLETDWRNFEKTIPYFEQIQWCRLSNRGSFWCNQFKKLHSSVP